LVGVDFGSARVGDVDLAIDRIRVRVGMIGHGGGQEWMVE